MPLQTIMLGFTSLPWDVIALVAELLENREIVRCWRVSYLTDDSIAKLMVTDS